MRRRERRRVAGAALAAALLAPMLLVSAAFSAVASAAAGERPRWDTRVFALVPKPGFPALAYRHPNRRIYTGTYTDPRGDTLASRVFEYTGGGTLLRSWTITGQDLSAPHGVQVVTSDARGRLVLLDRTPARALLLDPRTGAQTRYATFPDLRPCQAAQPAAGCSPTLRDQPPMANHAAWGADGSLYVTDYQQAVVWRVPAGGGRARVWLADRRLDGDQFGTTGLALAADRHRLLFAQQSSAGFGDAAPSTGKLYTVTIRSDGRPGPIRQLWASRPLDGPDGFAVARSGRVYLTLTGAAQIVVLAPDGRELERFPQQPLTGDNGSPVPFDSPSSATFLGTRLIVANQSYAAGNPDHQALLDVEIHEHGRPEFIPANAGARRP